jgi:hypothetical protein
MLPPKATQLLADAGGERIPDGKHFAKQIFWVISSPVERIPDKNEVEGPTPSSPTQKTCRTCQKYDFCHKNEVNAVSPE